MDEIQHQLHYVTELTVSGQFLMIANRGAREQRERSLTIVDAREATNRC